MSKFGSLFSKKKQNSKNERSSSISPNRIKEKKSRRKEKVEPRPRTQSFGIQVNNEAELEHILGGYQKRKQSPFKPAYNRSSESLSRDPDYFNRVYGINQDRIVGAYQNKTEEASTIRPNHYKNHKGENKVIEQEVYSAALPESSVQFKNGIPKNPRVSQFKPRTTLVEPQDSFPYKLGRDSVPRRSTLYHGVDYEMGKCLTEDQLRKSVLKSKEPNERPSTSKDCEYSYPYKESAEPLKEDNVDYGKRVVITEDKDIYNTDQRSFNNEALGKTSIVRFRPGSVANSKPSATAKLMVFRADQMEHNLLLGKNVHTIPLKHQRYIPTLLTGDGKLLEPVGENNFRKSSIKPDKNSKTVKINMTEIENVSKLRRKSVNPIELQSSGLEDISRLPRKSILRDKDKIQALRNSIARDEMKNSIPPSLKEEKRYSVVQMFKDDEINNHHRNSSQRQIDLNSNTIPVTPARVLTSQSIVRHSICPTKQYNPSFDTNVCRNSRVIEHVIGDPRHRSIVSTAPSFDANVRRNSRVIDQTIGRPRHRSVVSTAPSFDANVRRNSRVVEQIIREPIRRSVVSTAPASSSGKRKQSIVLLHVENPTCSVFSGKKSSLLYEEDNFRTELGNPNQHSNKNELQIHSTGPVLHRSKNQEYKYLMEYDQESPLIKKYSEYYKNLNSPAHHAYTAQILDSNFGNQYFDKEKNRSVKKKENLFENKTSQSVAADFCGLSEAQQVHPSNLKTFSNIKRVPSAIENDLDSLCFPNGTCLKNTSDSDSKLRWRIVIKNEKER